MRFVVLFFGLIGCILSALAGVVFIAPSEFERILSENGIRELEFLFDSHDRSPKLVGIFLLVAAGYGVIGSLLGLFRCGWQGSLLHAIPLLGAAVIEPFTLAATSLQGLSAVLSLYVRPLPIIPVAKTEDD